MRSISHHICPSVPTGSPQDVIAVAVNSSSIRLTWAPPLPEEQNGVITAYHLTVTEAETGEVLSFETHGLDTLLIVNSLHPYYTYYCTVAAFTVGLGPSASVDVQTLEEG